MPVLEICLEQSECPQPIVIVCDFGFKLTTPAHSQGVYTTLSIPGASIVSASGINDSDQVVGDTALEIFLLQILWSMDSFTAMESVRCWTILGQPLLA